MKKSVAKKSSTKTARSAKSAQACPINCCSVGHKVWSAVGVD